MLTVVAIVSGLLAVALAVLVVLPYARLSLKRRTSAAVTPAPQQVWVQDGELLYVEAVTAIGVELLHFDARGKQVSRWRDSWDEWRSRLRLRTIYFTGQSRPLTTLE